jgi:hypothetical protein
MNCQKMRGLHPIIIEDILIYNKMKPINAGACEYVMMGCKLPYSYQTLENKNKG